MIYFLTGIFTLMGLVASLVVGEFLPLWIAVFLSWLVIVFVIDRKEHH